MEKYRCPACGATRYHGGRCRECFYTPFDEAIAHGNHYHAGEPLVLSTAPKATRPGQGCDSYSGKRMPRIRIPGFVWGLLAVALILFFPAGLWLVAIVAGIRALSKKTKG